MKVGRKTKLTPKLQTEICGYLADCCTIRTSCEAIGVSQTSFFECIRRGEAGEQPFAQFAQTITRARGRAKARIVRSLLDERDWRGRLEILARVFPDEYGRHEVMALPQPPPPDLSKSVRITCYDAPDVDLMQFTELKAKLEAAGIKTDFPVIDCTQPACAPPVRRCDEPDSA